MKRVAVIVGVFGATVLACLADSRFTGFSDPRLSTPEFIALPTPEAVDFMKGADAVSLFHADLTKKPTDAKYKLDLRQVSGEERARLVAIFIDPANYYQGLYTIIELPPPDFGIEFRKRDEQLILICGGMLIEGNFGERKLRGVLATSGNHLFSQWCQKYCQLK